MGGPVNDALEAELEHLARTPQLLIACDYDGTIAPIVDDPMAADPRPDTVVALRALAALANTHVAVISGRSLRDLALLSRLPTEIHLVGSHGGEFDLGFGKRLSPRELDLRAHIKADLSEIAARTPGSELEIEARRRHVPLPAVGPRGRAPGPRGHRGRSRRSRRGPHPPHR